MVHSHPRWVVSALWDALGGGRAGIEELLTADNERPEVTLVARPGRATVAELAEALGGGAACPAAGPRTRVRLADGGDPAGLEAVREGRAGVQDEGSQLVAIALAAAPLDGPDRRWLDGCAGPGGKAALLAALGAERGAALVASEKQPHRARLVARSLAGNPGPVPGDHRRRDPARVARRGASTGCWWTCRARGLGALRRRPESRWRRRPRGRGRLRAAPARAAAFGTAARCGSAGSSATPPARRTSPRPGWWSTTCCRAGPAPRGRRRAGGRPSAAAGRTVLWATVRTSSCGRTCTAPTRCTWPCCAARPEYRPVSARRRSSRRSSGRRGRGGSRTPPAAPNRRTRCGSW